MRKPVHVHVYYITDLLNVQISLTEPSTKAIILETSSTTDSESYELDINSDTKLISLKSGDAHGMFYAVQSLRSILDGNNNLDIPSIQVVDKPRFPYRGMHVDVSRNFHSIDDVKRLMEVMAMYKMNKLHLHLSDDEGWRLEIPDLPELTQVE